MASRSASRTVMVTISVPSGRSGSGWACARGASAAGLGASGFGARRQIRLAAGRGTIGFLGSRRRLDVERPSLLSPSARITAIGVLTATSAVPSGIRILPSVPSSTASTSMVALSVSISAITSPDLTASPSFLSHLARLPFSIVGERAGISTWIGIERGSSTHHFGSGQIFPNTGCHSSGSWPTR